MKLSQTKNSLCPFKMNSSDPDQIKFCDDLKCMGWVPYTDPVYEKPEEKGYKRGLIIGRIPKNPAEGECGMIPPTIIDINQ